MIAMYYAHLKCIENVIVFVIEAILDLNHFNHKPHTHKFKNCDSQSSEISLAWVTFYNIYWPKYN